MVTEYSLLLLCLEYSLVILGMLTDRIYIAFGYRRSGDRTYIWDILEIVKENIILRYFRIITLKI